MAFNIDSFRSQALILGGARPTLFQCQITTPPQLGISNEGQRRFVVTCEAASIPSMDMGEVQVFHFGRAIKLHGDRTYPDWEVSVINDEDYVVRGVFEKWNNAMNVAISNYRDPSVTDELSYKCDMEVTQYGKNGQIIRSYMFVGAWPKVVGPMQLAWEATNQIQKFGVTFAYDYWIPLNQGQAADTYDAVNPSDGQN